MLVRRKNTMKHCTNWRTISLASALLVTASTLALPAHADEWNKRTVMTIDQPILVPRTELPAGTYVVKLLSSQTDRHVVQIFNANESHLITTILAFNNYRLEPTGKSQFTFWETPAGDPPALRAWFYPGDNFGQEFAYPKDMVAKLSAMNKGPIPTDNTATAAVTPPTTPNTPTEVTPPVNQPETSAMATPPAQTEQQPPATPPQPATQPTTPPEPATQPPAASTPSTPPVGDADRSTPTELPTTATDYPAIALGGFASLLAFGLLTLFARRRQTNS
jgi:hypothetical protein